MRRTLFTLCSACSLLLCVAVCVMWVRSQRRGAEFARISENGDRFTLRSEGGRLTLWAYPRGHARPEYAVRIRAMRDDDVRWEIQRAKGRLNPVAPVIDVGGPSYQLLRTLGGGPGSERELAVTASLLRALEDERTFVAAHLILSTRADTLSPRVVTRTADGTKLTIGADGLIVELVTNEETGVRSDEFEPAFEWVACAAHVDVGQLSAIREQWHRRLDASVWSLSYAATAAALSMPPFVWAAVAVTDRMRRRRRTRRRLCPACGYDLRATPARCPECGRRATA